MKLTKGMLLMIIFSAFLCAAFGQEEKGNLLIRNANVITVTKGNYPATDILVKDGRIAAIGKNLSASDRYRVIDATGLYVMPGIIDAHSHAGLDAINEATTPVSAEVNVADVLNPFHVSLYRALAGGVTTIHAMHGSANAIGGQCATVKLRYGVKDPESLLMKGAPRTIKFALGENPTRVHGAGGIVPRTRMGVEFVIRQAFSEAREYNTAWEKYNQQIKQKGFRGAPPVYSKRLETLADILKGKVIIHCHSYRADELQMMLKICKDFNINKIVFQHVNEGFKVAPELAEHGAMASVFSDWWAYKLEVYYSTAYNAAILMRNGVITSINSDDQELMRHLYHEAAKTQKYGGLSDDEALALITLHPAKQLGIEKRVGSIEISKEADLAIFNNHPLSIYAVPMFTIVDGIVRFDREKDPDDMRLHVDPNLALDGGYEDRRDHFEHCMDEAITNFEHMFEQNLEEK